MRFGFTHRLMTGAMAAFGLLALASSNQLDSWVRIAMVVGLVLALAVPQRWQDHPALRYVSLVGPVVLLLIQLVRWSLGSTLLPLAVEFAAAVQLVRLATRRGAAHDQQVIVLALLHLIAGTVIGGGLAYGICFVGFLIVAPTALVLSHLRREVEGNYRQGARDRTGLPVDVPRILRSRRVIGKPFLAFTCSLAVPIFALTGLLFVLLPRAGLSLLLLNHGRPERMVGFSDRVDLGGVGKLRSDPTIAMRVAFPKLPKNPPVRRLLYLRGTAFDRYDGRSWSRSLQFRRPARHFGHRVPLERRARPQTDLRLVIELEPINPPVLFVPPSTVAVELLPNGTPLGAHPPTVFKGPEDELKYFSTEDRGLNYAVYIGPGSDPPVLLGADRMRYLALPATVGPQVTRLARQWAGGETDPSRQAKAIEERLRTEYRYDLDSPSGASEHPLQHFLFESKRGHCEFYSTAMAVLLRTLGVPTRNVTGFIGGTYNRFGDYYAVRQGDAHSWVEVFVDGEGWVRFDPTPPSGAAPRSEISGVLASLRDLVEAMGQRWSRHVVGYDTLQRDGLFSDLQARFLNARFGDNALGVSWSWRRIAVVLAGLSLVAVALALLRRNRNSRGPQSKALDPKQQEALQAVELYRTLERALAARGVPRFDSTPPLAHAHSLQELHHPWADEVLALTRLYLELRFGGRSLTKTLSDEFQQRIRALPPRVATDEDEPAVA